MRSEEHTSELKSRRDLHSFPTRRSSDLVEKFLQHAFQIVGVKLGVTFVSAPEGQGALARERDGHAALFLERAASILLTGLFSSLICRRDAGSTLEHPPDFKQRHVIIFVTDVVPD